MGGIKKTKPGYGLNLLNELQLSPAELWVRFSSRSGARHKWTAGNRVVTQTSAAASNRD